MLLFPPLFIRSIAPIPARPKHAPPAHPLPHTPPLYSLPRPPAPKTQPPTSNGTSSDTSITPSDQEVAVPQVPPPAHPELVDKPLPLPAGPVPSTVEPVPPPAGPARPPTEPFPPPAEPVQPPVALAPDVQPPAEPVPPPADPVQPPADPVPPPADPVPPPSDLQPPAYSEPVDKPKEEIPFQRSALAEQLQMSQPQPQYYMPVVAVKQEEEPLPSASPMGSPPSADELIDNPQCSSRPKTPLSAELECCCPPPNVTNTVGDDPQNGTVPAVLQHATQKDQPSVPDVP